MKFKKYSLIVALLSILIGLDVCASRREGRHPTAQQHCIKNDKVICVTIPKSGTHLLLKCLTLFDQPNMTFKFDGNIESYKPVGARKKKFDRLNRFDPPHHYKGEFDLTTEGPISKRFVARIHEKPTQRLFWASHWPYTKEADAYFGSKAVGNFFIIRDPRDMIVSMAHMVQRGWNGEFYENVQDLIFDFIDGRQKHFLRWAVEVHSAYPLLWEYGVVGFYNMYLPWMNAKKFYTVRFENLVGAKGGGSDEAQFEEIKKMAEHIGLKLAPEKIKEIGENLFGGSKTFRSGQIGGWKKHFTPEMKAAFKKAPGANQLLIDLGYEKDENW